MLFYTLFTKRLSSPVLELSATDEQLMTSILYTQATQLHTLIQTTSDSTLFLGYLALIPDTATFLSAIDENGHTPIILAATLKKTGITGILIEEMNSHKLPIPWGQLLLAAFQNQDFKTFKMILEKLPEEALSAALDIPNEQGQNIIHLTALHPQFFGKVLSHIPKNTPFPPINRQDHNGDTPYHIATQNHHSLEMIEKHSTPQKKILYADPSNYKGYRLFLNAVTLKNINAIKWFLKFNSLNEKDTQGNTAFHLAANDETILALLLEKTPRPLAPIRGTRAPIETPLQHQSNDAGITPLQLAIQAQNNQTTQALMNTYKYEYLLPGKSPLQIATATGNEAMIALIISHPNFNSEKELELAIRDNNEPIVRAILDKFPTQDFAALTRIAAAVECDTIEILSLLYAKMPDKDFNRTHPATGNTIFHEMVLQGNIKGLAALLDLQKPKWLGLTTTKKVSPLPNNEGKTPIELCFTHPNAAKMLAVFCEKAPKLVSMFYNDQSLLHLAVSHQDLDAITGLVAFNRGELINKKTKTTQETPLHFLATLRNDLPQDLYIQIVDRLNATHQVNFRRENPDQYTPLQLAAAKGNTKACIAILSQEPTLIDHPKNPYSHSLLFLAALYHHRETLSAILNCQPNLTIKDTNGHTALEALLNILTEHPTWLRGYLPILGLLAPTAIPCRQSFFENMINTLTADQLKDDEVKNLLKLFIRNNMKCRNRKLHLRETQISIASLYAEEAKSNHYTFSFFTLKSTKQRILNPKRGYRSQVGVQ